MNVTYPPKRRYADWARQKTARLRILVVAPHPDDDAIGCGGTLARLAARGAHIAVTYVTDGSASHPRSVRFPPAVLRDIREDEARAALAALGVRCTPQFLRAPDSGLERLDERARATLVGALARRIARSRANIIFAPWLRDPHPDHVVTATLVDAALARGERRPSLYSYRVWLPVRGERADAPSCDEATLLEVVLNGTELARKRNALSMHRSQLGEVVDDDPDGFCIDDALLATWLTPSERFYRRAPATNG